MKFRSCVRWISALAASKALMAAWPRDFNRSTQDLGLIFWVVLHQVKISKIGPGARKSEFFNTMDRKWTKAQVKRVLESTAVACSFQSAAFLFTFNSIEAPL